MYKIVPGSQAPLSLGRLCPWGAFVAGSLNGYIIRPRQECDPSSLKGNQSHPDCCSPPSSFFVLTSSFLHQRRNDDAHIDSFILQVCCESAV